MLIAGQFHFSLEDCTRSFNKDCHVRAKIAIATSIFCMQCKKAVRNSGHKQKDRLVAVSPKSAISILITRLLGLSAFCAAEQTLRRQAPVQQHASAFDHVRRALQI
jgi:hypothetical protein